MNTDPSQLSVREKEVVDLLLQGKSNKEIALALGVSVSTVEFHLKNVYRKLGVRSRTEAILQLGLTTSGEENGKPGQAIGAPDGKLRESIVDERGTNAENGGNSIHRQVIPMKQKFFVIGAVVVLVLLTGAVLARFRPSRGELPLSNPSEAAVPAIPLMSGMGTSFVFPPGLGDGTENELVPQSTGYQVWPQHVKISLVGYPLQKPDTAYTPQILVFPADVYRHVDQCAEGQIQGLETILQTGAIALPEPLPCTFNPDTLPFLPDQKAAQVFHAAEKILPFQNGTGIRYITQYSQAAFPAVDNAYLIYTFQGLTGDGKYYVSVTLPVHLDALNGTVPTPANAEESASSLKAARDLLDQEEPALQPLLTSLDALVQSISAGIQP
jgi:DNA-binding CsgD family transcriptional regulator